MNQIFGEERAEISADRSRRRVHRVRRAHQGAHDSPNLRCTSHDQDGGRRSGDETDELSEEGLVRVLGIVIPGGLFVYPSHLAGYELKALSFEPSDDLPDESALDGVRFADDKGAVHGRRRLAV